MDKATQLFVNYMKGKHDLDIEYNESIWEAVTMYHEEIDPEMILEEQLKILPDPLLLLTTNYFDDQDQEWIFCIVADNNDSSQWYTAVAVCLRDGELIDNQILFEY
ncbi:hypothetical protein GN156_06210 [bacterium LRH843]|nr:hypothetical protein [bacterium LRH843]